jgi:hypothetical protein
MHWLVHTGDNVSEFCMPGFNVLEADLWTIAPARLPRKRRGWVSAGARLCAGKRMPLATTTSRTELLGFNGFTCTFVPHFRSE